MSIKIYHDQIVSNRSVLKITGDVKTVLNGLIDESNMNDTVLDQLKFALGAGSCSTCACVGESIVLNQIGYSCHLNNQGELITDKAAVGFRSPFLMGVELDSQPSSLLEINYQEGITLNELFNDIGFTLKNAKTRLNDVEPTLKAYALVGCLLFKNLACTYLKKPPIFKENINQQVEKYWAKAEDHPDCYVYLFSVVIREAGQKHFSSNLLEKAFYVNPQENNQGTTLSHTHAVLLREPISFSALKQDFQFYEKLDPEFNRGVRHVLTQSVVKEGLLALYNFRDIEA